MASVKKIWVTGANGQLGRELQELASFQPEFNFIFSTRVQVPIQNKTAVDTFLTENSVDVCINAAAYTAVDLAEQEKEFAMEVNGTAVGNLAASCKKHGVRFLHVSTDYVFNGEGKYPYKETDTTEPVNYYGQTKLKGEELARKEDPDCIIVRTSWVYSSFGKNFVKTILRLMNEKESIGVVSDQFGCPTYAADLAEAIFHLATSKAAAGIYHYCNDGVISWFDFATAIKEISNSQCQVNAIKTADYPTPAKRPAYSALDTTKIRNQAGMAIPNWKDSLAICIPLIHL
ncbi:MAG: dTDP-4-dehydrorhamnose reductase [Chitinophagaceae bacterium]|nr:MAG: dTDP-4-dehydrorhamnose reductase [Chitinophagaceae bacterium]